MESSTKALIPGLISAVLTSLVGTGLLSAFLLDSDQSKSEMFMTIDNKHNKTILEIKNVGETTLTNYSVFIESPQIVEKILNNFSTTEIFLPIQNITLRNGESSDINKPYLEIKIPQIVKNDGSVILIDLFINDITSLDTNKIRLNGVYDQGSTKGSINSENYFKNIISLLGLIGIAVSIFAIIFFFMMRIDIKNLLKKKV